MGKETRLFSDPTDVKFHFDTGTDENLSWFRALSILTLWVFETPKEKLHIKIKNYLDFIDGYFKDGNDNLIDTVKDVKGKITSRTLKKIILSDLTEFLDKSNFLTYRKIDKTWNSIENCKTELTSKVKSFLGQYQGFWFTSKEEIEETNEDGTKVKDFYLIKDNFIIYDTLKTNESGFNEYSLLNCKDNKILTKQSIENCIDKFVDGYTNSKLPNEFYIISFKYPLISNEDLKTKINGMEISDIEFSKAENINSFFKKDGEFNGFIEFFNNKLIDKFYFAKFRSEYYNIYSKPSHIDNDNNFNLIFNNLHILFGPEDELKKQGEVTCNIFNFLFLFAIFYQEFINTNEVTLGLNPIYEGGNLSDLWYLNKSKSTKTSKHIENAMAKDLFANGSMFYNTHSPDNKSIADLAKDNIELWNNSKPENYPKWKKSIYTVTVNDGNISLEITLTKRVKGISEVINNDTGYTIIFKDFDNNKQKSSLDDDVNHGKIIITLSKNVDKQLEHTDIKLTEPGKNDKIGLMKITVKEGTKAHEEPEFNLIDTNSEVFFPIEIDTKYLKEADFCKFRGIGFIQITARDSFKNFFKTLIKHLISGSNYISNFESDVLKNENNTDSSIIDFLPIFRKIITDPLKIDNGNLETYLTKCKTDDILALFTEQSFFAPIISINVHNHSKNNYLDFSINEHDDSLISDKNINYLILQAAYKINAGNTYNVNCLRRLIFMFGVLKEELTQ